MIGAALVAAAVAGHRRHCGAVSIIARGCRRSCLLVRHLSLLVLLRYVILKASRGKGSRGKGADMAGIGQYRREPGVYEVGPFLVIFAGRSCWQLRDRFGDIVDDYRTARDAVAAAVSMGGGR